MSRSYVTGAGLIGGLLVFALAGCAPEQPGPEITITPAPGSATSQPPASPPRIPPIANLVSGPRRVVEDYLKAARTADGATMLALIAGSERDDETAESLRKTAADRYSSATTWEILKSEEKGSAATVVVEFKGADVEPNPIKFALSRENGEWRILDSPELNEREKDKDRIRIKL